MPKYPFEWTQLSEVFQRHRQRILFGTALLFIGIGIGRFDLQFKPSAKSKSSTDLSERAFKRIRLSKDIVQQHPLSFAKLTEIEPTHEFVLPGRVQKDPTQSAMITARTQGQVVKVLVQESDRIKAGQILAVVQSTAVAQAEANHLKMLLRYDLAQKHLERATELYRHKILAEKEFEETEMEFQSVKTELEASRITLINLNLSHAEIENLEKTRRHSGELGIRSPIDGMVIERKGSLGQSVTQDDVLFVIGKTDQIWIVLDVYEKDLPFLSEGMSAELQIPMPEGSPKLAKGKIIRIAQEIDATTRSAKVWLEAKGVVEPLRIGQAISARLEGVQRAQMGHKLRVIPGDAIHEIEGDAILFVRVTDQEFEARRVKKGWTSDKWAEIKEGLSPEELVVIGESFTLKSELLKN